MKWLRVISFRDLLNRLSWLTMLDPRAVLLVLAPLFGPSFGPSLDADLNAALRALDSAEANEREQAERWLVEHLDSRDDAGLRAGLVAVELGPEASWRLSRALGARSTNLGLIMDLIVGANFASGEVSLDLDMFPDDDNAQSQRSLEREIGRRGLEHLLATWRSGLDRLPLSGAALKPLLLEERERNPWRMLTVPDGPVADVVSRLVRQGDVPIPVVMAQGLAEKLAGERFGGPFSKRVEPFRGAWDEVLLDFARAHDLAFEAVLYRGEDDVDEFAWLRLVAREEAGAESGSLQLSRALEDVARHVNRDAGANNDVDEFAPSISTGELQLAARFLASVGWDGGLTWLGDLWAAGDTKIARTALLEGAARGAVEPRLATDAGLSRLWLWAEDVALSADGGPVHLDRFGAALGHMPRWGTDGSDLLGVVVDLAGADGEDVPGWIRSTHLNTRAWLAMARLRLLALQSMQACPPAGVRLAEVVLATESGEGLGLAQWAALEALVHAEGELSPMPALNWPAVLALVPDQVTADGMAAVLARLGLVPPLRDADLELRFLRPSEVRVHVMTRLYLLQFEDAARLLVRPTADGGVGFGEPGSWGFVLEGGKSTRVFDELSEALRLAARSGEFLSVRELLNQASLQAMEWLQSTEPNFDLAQRMNRQEPVALARLALFAGVLGLDQEQLLCEQLKSAGDASPIANDPRALALLTGSAVNGAALAKERLLAGFEAALRVPTLTPGILDALELAVHTLWARNADAEAEALILEIAMVAAGQSNHPLAQRILFRPWPPAPL